MTMPAIAPPESPPLAVALSDVSVMLAPVATGVSNGIVVVGLRVLVTVVTVDDVGLRAAVAPPAPATTTVVAPAVTYVE